MEETSDRQSTEPNLSDELNSEIVYEYASTGQRFLNFLIDNLLMTYGLSFLTEIAVGVLLGLFFPEYVQRLSENRDPLSTEMLLLSYLVGVVNYLLYYTICEKGFKGHTLGKLITGTRVIRNDGDELTFKDALLRTLCRLVPFEILSAFGGHPWHDTWTKTSVIKTR